MAAVQVQPWGLLREENQQKVREPCPHLRPATPNSSSVRLTHSLQVFKARAEVLGRMGSCELQRSPQGAKDQPQGLRKRQKSS